MKTGQLSVMGMTRPSVYVESKRQGHSGLQPVFTEEDDVVIEKIMQESREVAEPATRPLMSSLATENILRS